MRWRDEFFKTLVLSGKMDMNLADYVRYGASYVRNLNLRVIVKRLTN